MPKSRQLKMQEVPKVSFLKGADEICEFIRADPKCINQLVAEEGLPAWKRKGNGLWFALDVDLCAWMISQRNRYLKDTLKWVEKMDVNT
jgi:hypothetical protein